MEGAPAGSRKCGGTRRHMRRPVRVDLGPPNRAMAAARLAAGIFVAATVIYGFVIGGYPKHGLDYVQDQTRLTLIRAGFTVRHLDIEGQNQASREDILEALRLGEGATIFSIDAAAVKRRLERIAWVHRAKVMRLLPSTVHIVIDERVPFAVWQIEGEMRLIDAEGRVIAALGIDQAKMPLVVGKGAPGMASDLFALLETRTLLRTRVLAAVRVGDRRWTLKLKNGVEIKLPEERIKPALERLGELEQAHGVLSANIASIDLRLADRITVRLTDKAAARRDAAKADEKNNGRNT